MALSVCKKIVGKSHNVSKLNVTKSRLHRTLVSLCLFIHEYFPAVKTICCIIIYTTMYIYLFLYVQPRVKLWFKYVAQKSRSFHFSNASKAETILTQLFSLFEALCSAIHIEFCSKILSGNLLTWENILPYSCHYNPRLVFFQPTSWKTMCDWYAFEMP